MGDITINITNGTAPYLVETIPDCGTSWNFGSAGVKVLHDVPCGDYAVKVTDANGCEVVVGGIVFECTTTTTCNTCEGCVEYGYLYNWYAATDARNIAASGWHVPTMFELYTLESNMGTNSYDVWIDNVEMKKH